MTTSTPHKAGFVNIVGNPNVGKSTLMNDLVGERLSIITSRPRQRAPHNGNRQHRRLPDSVLRHSRVLKPKYKLQQSMLDFSTGALTDADVLVYVTDVVEDPSKNADFVEKVAREKVPVLLVINKIDLPKDQNELEAVVERWHSLLPNAEVFPVSAKERFNVDNLMNAS